MNYREVLAHSVLTGFLVISQLNAPRLAAQSEAADGTSYFSRQWLQDHARDLASRPFAPQQSAAGSSLRELDYDDYRRIVFDPAAAVWKNDDIPFQLQLFHPGFLHTESVNINLISSGQVNPLPFSTEQFQYHESLPVIDPADVSGYAGFRIHHPINTAERFEEFLVFLGASYFRGVGQNQFYGLSARGLAVNTVGAGGEEFPRFSDFWIEQPSADSEQIVVHALLDSPSVTGAYQFEITPGVTTVMDVQASLYPRRNIQAFGIAPLTSMFMFDASNSARFDDFRDAVHDSDGLWIQQRNAETVWRPLANPKHLQVSAFGSQAPVAFGLMQRHTAFDDFNDAEARYDKRPSLWIEPTGDWGAGHVELVEIPTVDEIHDNIVAYWQPADALEPGQVYHYSYRMNWGQPAAEPGTVVETAAGDVFGTEERLFVVDYSDALSIARLLDDPDLISVQASTSDGIITDVSATVLPDSGRYRVYVKLDPRQADLAELRVTLQLDGRQWGETWLYRWTR